MCICWILGKLLFILSSNNYKWKYITSQVNDNVQVHPLDELRIFVDRHRPKVVRPILASDAEPMSLPSLYSFLVDHDNDDPPLALVDGLPILTIVQAELVHLDELAHCSAAWWSQRSRSLDVLGQIFEGLGDMSGQSATAGHSFRIILSFIYLVVQNRRTTH